MKINSRSKLQTIPIFLWGWVLTVGLLTDCSSGGSGDVALPLSPAGIIATAGDGQTTITWNPVAGATSYRLYMNTQPGISLTNPANMHHPSVSSPFVHTNLTNGTTYYFVVTAVNKNGESIASAEVSATPQTLPLPVITLTATPSTIASGETSTLSWTSANSTSCISAGGGTGIIGSFTTPALTATTTYTVTCTGDGVSASGSATVTVAGAAVQFSSVPAAGTDPGSCVLDNTTGLMWEVKTADGGLRDWSKAYTNYDNIASAQKWNSPAAPNPTRAEIEASTNSVGFKNTVNTQGLCGFNDWRLPTLAELQSIVKTGSRPSIDTIWFPNTQSHFYWSTSPAVNVPSSSYKAWGVNFFSLNGSGSIDYRYLPSFVRLVRSAP